MEKINQLLEYPFDSEYLIKKRKTIKKELLASGAYFLDKKIAILGGSTTNDIKNMLELFLLNQGIKATFYESEFGQYWQDAMFPPLDLREFAPDAIYIHTSCRNITVFPSIKDNVQQINDILEKQVQHFEIMWKNLADIFNCPIIQNNFERPLYRLLGNKDISDVHGHTNFVTRLNQKLYEYAQTHEGFYINDIDYLSSIYGLQKWSDPFYWYMYKYALCVSAIPDLAFNVANIIKSIYGKNKKALVLDLDNTLWGGVIGDDGVDGIVIGPEIFTGQAYSDFQQYIKAHKDLGVILNVCSKNEYENAIAGLTHPDSSLKPDDFIVIKANWLNKDINIQQIANELNIGVDSLVFIDDNPVERDIVKTQIQGIAVPDIGNDIEKYIQFIDQSGFFEVTSLSNDDLNRNEMYQANSERIKLQQSFDSYGDYLKSLEMIAIIRDFESLYMQRIAQLTNKSNQFNLTTKRYNDIELSAVSNDKNYICLYGKLEDKFGDNGVVSVVIGRKDGSMLHIELWLMSCRVLKRDMEYAMLDALVEKCRKQGIDKIIGHYYRTAKNSMVSKFYNTLGFEKIDENNEESTIWSYNIENYKKKNHVIKVL